MGSISGKIVAAEQRKNNLMTVIELEEIAKLRGELAENQEALAALDVIEEYQGNLAEAAKVIAIRNDIEGVADYGVSDWFAEMLRECREVICQPKYKDLRENYLPALVPPVADCVAGSLGCPPGIASLIATPIAIYIHEEGLPKFCQDVSPDP